MYNFFTPVCLTKYQLNNEDHCSSCRSYGALVYCDGCPRAFHLWCLDPPMEGVDDGDARWFCPTCAARKVSLIYFSYINLSELSIIPAPPSKTSPVATIVSYPSTSNINSCRISAAGRHKNFF